jgi:hypothetical protein
MVTSQTRRKWRPWAGYRRAKAGAGLIVLADLLPVGGFTERAATIEPNHNSG